MRAYSAPRRTITYVFVHRVAALVASLWTACALSSLAQDAGVSNAAEPTRGQVFLVEDGDETAVAGDGEATVRRHLARNKERYRLPSDVADLKLVAMRESLLGKHFHYRQYADGIPIFSAGVTVSVAHTNRAVCRVHSAAVPTEGKARFGKANLDTEAALDRAWAHIRVTGRLNTLPAAEVVWVLSDNGLRLAYRTEIACTAPRGAWEHLVDAGTGQVLLSRNRMRIDTRKRGEGDVSIPIGGVVYEAPVSRRDATAAFLAAKTVTSPVEPPVGPQVLFDSVAQGSAWVFDPDPKTTLLSDALLDTSPASAFVPAMVLRPLRDITFSAGVYRLTGPWVNIADFDNPTTAPSTTTDGMWAFPRGNNGFDDAMVYFHLDQSQRYLQALGYGGARGIQARSIPADSNGDNGADNSYFDPTMNRISYGHGGVDDAEDADVILHEYGHAIEYGINPSFDGGDTGAIGEGFGDYWAGSYSLSCSNGTVFRPDWVFQWDGHNSFWAGRVLNSTGLYTPGATYNAHTVVNGVLGDELWSAPLFQSLKRLLAAGRPREEADTVVIESHFGMGYGTTMPDMARSVVGNALALYPGGPHAGIYYSEFTNRNILTTWQLAEPAIVFPPAGECLVTGAVRHIRWVPRPAPVSASAVVQFHERGTRSSYWQNDVEGGAAGWTVSHSGGSVDWQRVTTTNHSPVTSWWADEQKNKTRMYLVSPGMALSNDVIFGFWHNFNLQTNYDGGVVEISTDGGASWFDVTTNVMSSGYNVLTAMHTYSDSPIGGRMAFSGSSGGFVQSFIDLGAYGGKTVNVRFYLASDTGIRAPSPRGWWVDDMVLLQDVWEQVGTTSMASCSIPWAPPRPMTGAVVRVKAIAPGCADSAWGVSGTFSVSGDSDGDGLPDTWELAKFGNLTVSAGTNDWDGDGSSDYAEWIAGTSPTQAVSVLRVARFGKDGTNAAAIVWTSATGRCYAVERTSDLAGQAFVAAVSNIVAVPATNSWQVTPPLTSPSFLRIRVEP